MNSSKKLTLFISFTILFIPFLNAKNHLIKPNNKLIHYVGRFDFSDSLEPKCSFTYSSIEAKFWGQHLSVSFTEYGEGGAKNTNYIEVVLDKRRIKTLKLKPGKHEYEISNELPINFHNVQFIKRTEGSVGKIGFNGLRIEEKKLYPIKERKIKLMTIGGSWSTGYGNELSLLYNIDTGFHSKNQDGSYTWASIVAEHYNADLHNISCSDVGLVRGANADTSKNIFNQLNLIHPYDTSYVWDHSQYQPDLIYIYLGDLDFIPELENPSTPLDSATFVKKYIQLVSTLFDLYPKALILCMEGGSTSNFNKYGWYNGFFQKSRWKSYTKTVVDVFTFLREPVYFQSISNPIKHPGRMRVPWGEDWNPSKAIHQRISYEVKDYFPLIVKGDK